MSFTLGEPVDMMVGGEKYLSICLKDESKGFSVYCMLRKIDSYYAYITITIADKTDISEILNYFDPAYKVNLADKAAAPSRGTWTDDVYSNTYTGLKYDLPEGWEVATNDMLAKEGGVNVDVFSDNARWLTETAKNEISYDTVMYDPDTGNHIKVSFANLPLLFGDANISEEDYLGEIKNYAGKDAEAPNTVDEPYDITVGSISYLAMHIFYEKDAFDQYYLIKKQDNFMVVLVVNIYDGTDIADIISNFE